MTNLSLLSLLILLIGPVSFRSCDRIIAPPEPVEQRIYFTSFETPADTIGWQGGMQIMNEAPFGGGFHSALISGGCLVPHAWYRLTSLKEDSYLIIKCWGKNLAIGGGISLELNNNEKQISIGISDSTWKSYQSADTLFCPKGSNIRLSMSAGGIVPSAMLVDLIEIIRVK